MMGRLDNSASEEARARKASFLNQDEEVDAPAYLSKLGKVIRTLCSADVLETAIEGWYSPKIFKDLVESFYESPEVMYNNTSQPPSKDYYEEKAYTFVIAGTELEPAVNRHFDEYVRNTHLVTYCKFLSGIYRQEMVNYLTIHSYIRFQEQDLHGMFVFSNLGKVDGKKTTEKLLKNEELSFGSLQKFYLAAYYCLEEEINNLWEEVKQEFDTLLCGENWKEFPIWSLMWACILRGNAFLLEDFYLDEKEETSLERKALDLALTTSNGYAAIYFQNKLGLVDLGNDKANHRLLMCTNLLVANPDLLSLITKPEFISKLLPCYLPPKAIELLYLDCLHWPLIIIEPLVVNKYMKDGWQDFALYFLCERASLFHNISLYKHALKDVWCRIPVNTCTKVVKLLFQKNRGTYISYRRLEKLVTHVLPFADVLDGILFSGPWLYMLEELLEAEKYLDVGILLKVYQKFKLIDRLHMIYRTGRHLFISEKQKPHLKELLKRYSNI